MTHPARGEPLAAATAPLPRHRLALPEGAGILTLDGLLPVEYLTPGDRIITRDGARVLAQVTAAVERGITVLRVAGSTLGHDRPDEALHLWPDTPVLIRDWRAKALFGQREALVPLSRLADGEHIRPVHLATCRILTLHFPSAVVVYVGGLELGSRVHSTATA